MAKIFGEAQLDVESGKYFYVVSTQEGEVLSNSEPRFESQTAAEQELVEILRGLSDLAKQQ
jgi:hypothetical protein